MLYLKDENLDKAIAAFNQFKASSNKSDKKAMTMADNALNQCNNAVVFMSVPRNTSITRLSSISNRQYTEYKPVFSADVSVLAITTLRQNTGKIRRGDKF